MAYFKARVFAVVMPKVALFGLRQVFNVMRLCFVKIQVARNDVGVTVAAGCCNLWLLFTQFSQTLLESIEIRQGK